jgi:hypothetical protein
MRLSVSSRRLRREKDRVLSTFDHVDGYADDRAREALGESSEWARLVETLSEVEARKDERTGTLREWNDGDLPLDDEVRSSLTTARREVEDAVEERGREVVEDALDVSIAGHSGDLRRRHGGACPACGSRDRLVYVGTRSPTPEEVEDHAPDAVEDADRVLINGWACHSCRSVVEEVVLDASVEWDEVAEEPVDEGGATWEWLLVDEGDRLLDDVERARERDDGTPVGLRLSRVSVGPALDLAGGEDA